ncbi:MAG TPA: hypothetical protein DCY79_04185 [Planctomycetaceae bacterium]|nr:hypothetical protein [Blastopirellula sp.]HAY78984.1 hypothetical protein [Planctomycetaceae bacterium]
MEPTPTTSACPDRQWLKDYASGTIDEVRAAMVTVHLETCTDCQVRVDDLSNAEDSLLHAMRAHAKPSTEPDPEHEQIHELIETVQNFDSSHSTHSEPAPLASTARSTTPPGWADLVDSLRRSGWLNLEQLQQAQAAPGVFDSPTLVNELVARNLLTRFQARKCLQGRWSDLTIGDYLVLEPLGEGGMATVFKARQRQTGRTVCIKTLNPTGRKSTAHQTRFRREFKAVQALQHPHLIVAHAAMEVRGIPCLIMDFVNGQDLAKYVAARGPLNIAVALKVLRQIAVALQYLHDQEIIHRDIKPHNLLLDSQGHVRVLDLGLARFNAYLDPNSDATTQISMTNSGLVMGSVDYMPPEQAMNAREVDARTDIYALGCTFFYLVTGKVIFPGSTLIEKLLAHRERPAPQLNAASAVETLFANMVAKAPEDRYPSMTQLVAAIDALTGDPRALSSQPTLTPKPAASKPSSARDNHVPLPSPGVATTGHSTAKNISWQYLNSAGTRPRRRDDLKVLFWVGIFAAAVGIALITQRLIPSKFTIRRQALVFAPISGVKQANYEALRKEFQNRGQQWNTISWKDAKIPAIAEYTERISVQPLKDDQLSACGTLFLLQGAEKGYLPYQEDIQLSQKLIKHALQNSQVLVIVGTSQATGLQQIKSLGFPLHFAKNVDDMSCFTTSPGAAPQVILTERVDNASRLLSLSQNLLKDLAKGENHGKQEKPK